MRPYWLAFAALSFTLPAFPATTPQTVKLFNDSCSACHSIGGGDLVGPDLIKEASLPRATVEKSVKRMEDNVGPLQPEQIAALVDLLQAPDAKTQIAQAANPPAVEIPPEQKAASAATGRMLFFGEASFANRGVPCAGCHTVGGRGGNLAVDLTSVHARRGSTAVLTAAEQPPFPLMKGAYGAHPITRQEAYHLLAFFEKPDSEHADHVGGIAGGIVLIAFAGVAVLFRSRRSGLRSRMVHQ